MLQAGDKGFYEYGRKLSKELNLELVVHCTGYQLEQREFFLGFLGVNERLKDNPTLSDYSLLNKFNMFFGLLNLTAHGHVIGNDSNFALKVQAPVYIRAGDILRWCEKAIAAALIH